MYNIKFENYVPKPNPAKSDRIIAAHYYAAWKKGAAGLHEGFDDLADIYPDRTPLMGYLLDGNLFQARQLPQDRQQARPLHISAAETPRMLQECREPEGHL